MSFNSRREYLFVYSVKDANPNGDPLNANHPRYDEDTGQILVSDVRIKRTIRDQWIREGKDVLIDGEPKTATTRIRELKEKFNVSKVEDICKKCIDTRLFGVTSPIESEAFSWIGPVQFKWGRSLHRAKAELIQGTAAFASRDGNEQRSFRNEYIVPFALIAVYGIANQNAAVRTGASDDDLAALKAALWDGTINLITRSKVGHRPEFLLEVVYANGFNGAICSLDEKVCLKKADGFSSFNPDEEYAIRSVSDCKLDISALVTRLSSLKNNVAEVHIRKSEDITIVGLDELKNKLSEKVVEE